MPAGGWQSVILEQVQGEGGVSISALAAQLNVSGETIRRHVRPLVEDGMLVRSHGQVRLADAAVEPPFSRRMRALAAEKRAIAQAVAGLVPDGATLMIDTGSTTAYVAQALVRRRGLTVITNSIEVARPFVGRNDHRVYIAGGEIRPDLSAVVGPDALAFLGQFRADLAILSIGAVDLAHGFADFHLDEARVAGAMHERADRTLIAADASKFTARAAVPVCGLGAVRMLVTDRAPAPAAAEAFATAGVEVRVASPG